MREELVRLVGELLIEAANRRCHAEAEEVSDERQDHG